MKMHKMLKVSAILLMAILVLSACGGQPDDAPEGGDQTDAKPTIRLGQVPYGHEQFLVAVMRQVFEDNGYPVEVVEGDVAFMFLGVAQDDIDIYPDAWLPTLHKTYMDQYQDEIEVVGVLYKDAALGWAVPEYVEIDSIADIQGNEAMFDDRVVGIEPSSGMMQTSEQIIEGYGLDVDLIEGSTPTMLAEVERASRVEEPIVFLAWRPHTMFQNFDIKLLEDPEGFWQFDDVKAAISLQLPDRAPDVVTFLENFQISIPDIEAGMVKMDEGMSAEDAAAEWIEENRDSVEEAWQG